VIFFSVAIEVPGHFPNVSEMMGIQILFSFLPGNIGSPIYKDKLYPLEAHPLTLCHYVPCLPTQQYSFFTFTSFIKK
jgi:hypothetical protein